MPPVFKIRFIRLILFIIFAAAFLMSAIFYSSRQTVFCNLSLAWLGNYTRQIIDETASRDVDNTLKKDRKSVV